MEDRDALHRRIARTVVTDESAVPAYRLPQLHLYLLMCRKLRALESMGRRFSGISLVGGGIDGPHISYDFGQQAAA